MCRLRGPFSCYPYEIVQVGELVPPPPHLADRQPLRYYQIRSLYDNSEVEVAGNELTPLGRVFGELIRPHASCFAAGETCGICRTLLRAVDVSIAKAGGGGTRRRHFGCLAGEGGIRPPEEWCEGDVLWGWPKGTETREGIGVG